MPPIKVVVIDDHPLIHETVAEQFSRNPEEFELVGTGTSGEEIELLVEKHQPDIVLQDLGLPIKRGTTIRQTGRYQVLPAVRRLHGNLPQTNFVIISSDADRSLVHAAVESGAKAYLIKDDELSRHLLDALRAVMNGGVYFSTEVAWLLAPGNPQSVGAALLTPNQIEILQEVKANANLTYADHARNLGVSEGTFHNHLRAIIEKLGASNLAFAIIRAIELGILPVDSPVQQGKVSPSTDG